MKKKIMYLFVLVATILMFTVSCIEQTYLVEFDSNGGTDIISQVVKYNTLIQEPTDPYKENHKFIGWYLGEEEYDFSTPVNGNLQLTAKWEVVCYNVVFDTDGGSEIETLKVGPGSFVRQPENPTKDKYEFAGWYLGEEEYDFSTPVESDITLVAKWENAKYLVSFDTDGGNAIDAQKVEINNFVTKPENPTKENYEFVGWYLNGEEYDFSTPIESDITLVAKWIYKLQLNEVVGTWSGEETMSGMSMATYDIVINPDGSGKASYNMSGYTMDLTVNKFTVEDYQLVMEYSNNGNPSTVRFAYEDGKLVSNGIVSGEYGQIALSTKDLVIEDIATTWEGVEVYSGMEIPYTVVINPDGSVEASFDMFGMVSPLTCVEINNKLVLSYMGLELPFVYDGAKFVGVGAMGSQLVLEEKKEDLTLDIIKGTWQGVEETSYGNYTYEITLKADGTGTGSYVDEAGLYPSDLEITEVVVNNNEVVMTYLSYGMEYTMTFTYEDGKLVTSQGAMWGSLTLEKTISLKEVAGTWVSSEEFYGMAIEYTFVINADGTGTAKYSTSYGDTIMTVEAYKVVDGKIVLDYNVDGFEYDPLVFEVVGGQLVGTSPMATTITLTKALSVLDLVGTWQGVEETSYGNYTYEITLKEDGTGTGSYVDEAGLYPSDLEITEVVVNNNEVVMTYLSYGMEYTMTFMYEDGKLATSQGAMWGSLTLEKE